MLSHRPHRCGLEYHITGYHTLITVVVEGDSMPNLSTMWRMVGRCRQYDSWHVRNRNADTLHDGRYSDFGLLTMHVYHSTHNCRTRQEKAHVACYL
jgi:hypothetical protein